MYTVLIKKSAEKSLAGISKKDGDRIDKAILNLSANPYPQGCKQLSARTKAVRIRQGDYRILYTVDDHKREVVIFRVRHRKEAYR